MEFDSVSQYRYNSLKVPLNIVLEATDGLMILHLKDRISHSPLLHLAIIYRP